MLANSGFSNDRSNVSCDGTSSWRPAGHQVRECIRRYSRGRGTGSVHPPGSRAGRRAPEEPIDALQFPEAAILPPVDHDPRPQAWRIPYLEPDVRCPADRGPRGSLRHGARPGRRGAAGQFRRLNPAIRTSAASISLSASAADSWCALTIIEKINRSPSAVST